MGAQIQIATTSEAEVALTCNKLVLHQPRTAGLLGSAKNTRLSGRVPSELIDAAKKRAHVTSDTELLELALSRLALEDDFGARLVSAKAAFPRTSTLGGDLAEPFDHSNHKNATGHSCAGRMTICHGKR